MATWTESIPVFVIFAIVTFLPGWLVVRALGLRGIESLAVSPIVTVTVIGISTTVTATAGLRWSWPLVVGSTLAFAGGAWLLARLPRRRPRVSPARRLLGRPQPDVAAAAALGALLAFATILPAIGRPDELVDSPDAVYHLDRIRLFLETGNFSLTNPSFYPSGFHAWVATGLMGTHTQIVAGTNVATILLAAVVWPLGVVALVRHALTPSRLVTYAAGLASAAFVSFPTILLGWGVLWPNLMGTAMTPAALVLMLQAGRRRTITHVLAFAAAIPGLGLIQPNALFALVLFAVAWYLASRLRAAVLRHQSWGRVAAEILVALLLLAAAILTAPLVSESIASTQSYAWERVDLWTALTEILGGRLQVPTVLWGLLGLLVLGWIWILWRTRAAIPVLAMWLAAVLLYLLAAASPWAWTNLLTGYWYNDKVRLASLAAVPGVVIVSAAAPLLRWWLTRMAAFGRHRRSAALLALAAIPLATVVADHGVRHDLLETFFHPQQPERVILSRAAQDQLAILATKIPPGAGVVSRPENGTPLMYALFGTNTLYRSIPVLSSGDNGLIGAGFSNVSQRPDVCAALARHGIRYAIDSPHTYWLDKPERTSGLFDLAGQTGLERIATAGDYTLYRITACGLGTAEAPR